MDTTLIASTTDTINTDSTGGTPLTECLAYKAMKTKWKLIRDLWGGTAAMQAAGKTWLPQWPKEEDDAYDVRLESSILFNGLKRTIKVLVGKVFAADIVLNDDVPEAITDWMENIDQEGSDASAFAREWFKDGLQTGVSHVLVDVASGEKPRTDDEAAKSGMRPYWVLIPAESLIWWQSESVGGSRRLTEIRFKEVITKKVDDWAEESVTRVRHFFLDPESGRLHWKVYEQDGAEWPEIEELAGDNDMEEIPLATFYAEKSSFMVGEPPCLDLAYTNLAHWRSASEQRHCLGIGRRPFPAFMGFTEEELVGLEIGPNSGPRSDNPDAKVEIIESGGTALAAGRQDLLDLKEEMAVLGAELLVLKDQVEKSATEAANKNKNAESDLGAMSGNFEDAYNNAIRFTGMMGLGKEDCGTVTVNREFGASILTQAELAAIVKLRELGELPRVAIWDEFRSRGVLTIEYSNDDLAAMLEAETEF